jgi:hypothetical protein
MAAFNRVNPLPPALLNFPEGTLFKRARGRKMDFVNGNKLGFMKS